MSSSFFNWQAPSASAFDADGRIQPLNCKPGELANRIVTVGDPLRAARFRALFDADHELIVRQSNMIFATYTGTVKGVPVSVVATGMGFAMAELLIAQARAITKGPLYVIRFGTSGSLREDVPVGCFAVTDVAYAVRQDYEGGEFPFSVTTTGVPLNADLVARIADDFAAKASQYRTVTGPGVSTDTFYASQGRSDSAFVMKNEKLIETLLTMHPNVINFEMETYVLALFAAKFADLDVRVGAVCITLAQRTAAGVFLDNDTKHDMEDVGANVLLELLAGL
jgi:uridine phosphorylase